MPSADVLPGTPRVSFSLSMLGWALNEEDSIAGYIDRAGAFLDALTDDYELILIDDGSSDRTWAIATEYSATRPWLKPYRNDRNRGSGYNTKRAISVASKDYLFWQTVDWAYDIRHLAKALGDLASVDVLQGVRVDTTSAKGMVQQRSDNPYKGPVSVVKRQRGRGTGTRPKAIIAAILDILYWWTQWMVLRRRSTFQRGRVIR
jgi:glycosyltransferase involved in cell wall biosynthesis